VAGAVAIRLRADGHEVAAARDMGADPGDVAILAIAVAKGRILVTLDSDFGALVFRDGARQVGVLRLRAAPALALADRASQLLDTHGDDLERGAFVTDDVSSARVSLP
jgi:predicted nuclease of predicted toxin-antitoxin system